MRSFITLGVLSLVGAAALMACGDDDGTRPGNTAGTGGRAGAGGGANAGAAGRAGSAGVPGGGGAGGAAQVLPAVTCTGCVEVRVPFTAAGQRALYQLNYPTPGVDLSNAVITWKVQVLTPNAGIYVKPQVQNGGPTYPGYFAAPQVAATAAAFPAGVWTTVTLDLSALPAAPVDSDAGVVVVADAGADGGDAGAVVVAPGPTVFDKSRIEAVQLQIGSTAAGTGTALVVIDEVTITGAPGVTGATFNAGTEGFVLNANAEPTLIPVGAPPVAAH
jgi:hypothetical protein